MSQTNPPNEPGSLPPKQHNFTQKPTEQIPLTFTQNQRLLFISDLHLEPSRPDITTTFFSLLESIQSQQPTPISKNLLNNDEGQHCSYDALFILGDFFEVWIGDDHETDLANSVAHQLLLLHQSGLPIYFMAGNRDFLLGESYCRKAGMQRLIEPTKMIITDHSDSDSKDGLSKQNQYPQKTWHYLLMHGDALCTDDHAYMAFRKIVRSSDWQQQFLSQPISERLKIAREIRNKSESKKRNSSTHSSKESSPTREQMSDAITDVSQSEVLHHFDRWNINTLIHGHTHRPAIHQVPAIMQHSATTTVSNEQDTSHDVNSRPVKSLTRAVLGDWDKQGWALTLHQNQLKLKHFPLADHCEI